MTDIKPEWTNSPERLKELRDWEVKTELATENDPNDDHLNHFQSGTYIFHLSVCWYHTASSFVVKEEMNIIG